MIRIGDPATTIDTPLQHLTACHRRIEDRLDTLRRAADHWRAAPNEALEAIRKSIEFLNSSGTLHTMDEEESLFPRLRPHLSGQEAADLDRLEQQHREVDSVMAKLKDVVAGLADSPAQAMHLELQYREIVTRLSELYRPHIEFEDEVLMRLAGRILDAEDLQKISLEMRARRNTMDEMSRKVLQVFVTMGRESLDLHLLFEAGGNDPAARSRVLDAVVLLVGSGDLESRGSDFYLLTGKGKRAVGWVNPELPAPGSS